MVLFNETNMTSAATPFEWFKYANVLSGNSVGLFILLGTFLVIYFATRNLPMKRASLAASCFATAVIAIFLRIIEWIPNDWVTICFIAAAGSMLWLYVGD